MFRYVQAQNNREGGQLLQLMHAGRRYRFRMEHGSIDEPTRGPSTAEHGHTVYHIVLYTQGEGEHLHLGVPRRFGPGTLALTGPNEPHLFTPCSEGTATYTEMTFSYLASGERALTLPFHRMLALHAGMAVPFRESPFALEPDAAAELVRVMERGIRGTAAGGVLDAMRLCNAAAEAFELILRTCYFPSSDNRQGGASALERVRLHIERYYAGHLDVPALARMAHLSTGYFQRAYRDAYGLPPIAHQQRLRIGAAQTLLRTTSLRGKEIAARLGFADEYAFSKAFRKLVGMPPMAFRRAAV